MTEFVDVWGMRIRVRITGSGDPLLLIMGLGGSLDMWAPLTQHLDGRQLITFDFPGTGGSAENRLLPAMGVNALFIRHLLGVLGHERVDVLGYSWGGLLAQHLAMQHRRTVRRLVLAATTVGLGGVPAAPDVLARMLTPARYYSRAYFTRIAPTIYGGRFRTDRALADEEVNRRIGHPPGLRGYTAQLLATLGYSTLPGLPFITAPTLILAGDDDPIVPTANQRLLSRLIPDARLHLVPGAGHLLLLDSPEIAAPVVSGFLRDR